ncbi:MAG: sigma-54 dependent transcriptional regulator [Desulfobacterales bacterium]|nr:sigma-54 dependent transcriptional regulator [Desulfobacterales bacterium]
MNPKNKKFSLLLVDDEDSVLNALKHIFLKDNYDLHISKNGNEALSLIKKIHIDAAIVDFQMPEMDGLSLLKKLKNLKPDIMVVILTAWGGIKEAVEAIKSGADDFLEKPFSCKQLQTRIGQFYKIWILREENRKFKNNIECSFSFSPLIGESPPMLSLKQTIIQVAQSDTSILLQGETGSGKELVARAIHFHSNRSKERFVTVDCAAINSTIMESELFGHLKGAFTGAYTDRNGLVRAADKGTLFLDEIGDLSSDIQAKLLRILQEREVRPVGSSKIYPVDIRVLAATNRNLEKDVANGKFREDLFYRLNVISLTVPSLNERKKDIPLLAKYFVCHFKNDYSPVHNISDSALICLENYNWPGNVRELENVINRAVIGVHPFFYQKESCCDWAGLYPL